MKLISPVEKRKSLTAGGNVLIGVVMLIPVSPGAAGGKTLENLMTAYNGESNAQAKYLAYAQKADQEGYGKVASPFRAARRVIDFYRFSHQKRGNIPMSVQKSPRSCIFKLPPYSLKNIHLKSRLPLIS